MAEGWPQGCGTVCLWTLPLTSLPLKRFRLLCGSGSSWVQTCIYLLRSHAKMLQGETSRRTTLTSLVIDTTFWLSAQHFGCRYNILVIGTTFWLSAQHFDYRHNSLVIGTTFWLSAQHFGYRHNILAIGTTFWLSTQHFGYGHNILAIDTTFYFYEYLNSIFFEGEAAGRQFQ